MKNMNLLVAIICSIILLVGPAACVITFDLDAPQKYAAFVEEVRKEVSDASRSYHGIPMMKPPSSTNKYLYIQVNAKADGLKPAISVTLQLQRADLYLVAYRDRNEKGLDRAFYFMGLVPHVNNDVFPGVTNINRERMRCDHDYGSIEGVAAKRIKDLEFSLPKLKDAMRNAYGKSTIQGDFGKTQALFLLYSIEMTAEAARFKYIELKTVHNQKSDVEVASLVTIWSQLSVQIAGSPEDGAFAKPIQIQVFGPELGDKRPPRYMDVKKVSDIKPDIGILSYIQPNQVLGFAAAHSMCSATG